MPTETYTTGRTATAEPMVTITLSRYTDMVKRIQKLEDQMEALEEKRCDTLVRMYAAEEKLKEAGIA